MVTTPQHRNSRIPLSPRQRRIWYQQSDQGTSFVTSCELHITGSAGEEDLRRSLENVVRRHQILRTSFQREGGLGIPVQSVDDQPAIAWESIRFDMDPVARQARLAELAAGGHVAALFALGGEAISILFMGVSSLRCDKASLAILAAELKRELEGTAGNAVAAEAIQYADAIRAQRESLAGGYGVSGRDFWRDYCRGHEADAWPSVFSSIERGGSTASFLPRVVRRRMDESFLQAMDSLCYESKCSPGDLLFAAWVALLFRLTGRTPMPVGREFDGRTDERSKNTVGPLARFLPLRIPLESDESFRGLLARTASDVEAARKWQSGFDWGLLDPEGHGPLLPAVFEYVDVTPASAGGRFGVTPAGLESTSDVFRLKLAAIRTGEGISLQFAYDANRFDTQTVEAWADGFEALVRGAAENPQATLAELPLLTSEGRYTLFEKWNGPSSEPSLDSVHEAIARRALTNPDRVALKRDADTLTFDELNRRADQMAAYLRSKGVNPKALVGIFMERSTEMVVAILGVLKAGCAYVPLDPAYPKLRLQYILEDSAAAVVLAHRAIADNLPDFGGSVICVDAEWPAISAMQAPEPSSLPPADPGDLAYVLFTSGSTGRPKGCQIEHRNLMHYLGWANRAYFQDEHAGSFPLFSSLSFDLTVTSLFLPLLRGKTLHLYPQHLEVSQILQNAFAPESGIDAIKLTPSHVSLLEHLPLSDTRINVAIVGGEALTPHQVGLLHGLNPAMRVFNEYGPTETTVGCVVEEVRPGEAHVLIGKPIHNTAIYIVDTLGNPVPVGVPGEILIAGEGVGRGYLNRDDLTQAVFQENPFGTFPRLYRTGDSGRWLPDGRIDYLGRIDSQVKVRGYRIEPGEIESVLSRHPEVKQAVVGVVPSGSGEPQLVAWLTTQTYPCGTDSIGEYLKERLPSYMVPSAMLVLPSLPFNANGKVDRSRLPAPEEIAAGAYTAPRTETEVMLAEIWAELLGLERVGIHDDFFQLGGHSLTAIQLVSRVRDLIRFTVDINLVFEHTTIEKLAIAIDESRQSGSSIADPWQDMVAVPREAYRSQ